LQGAIVQTIYIYCINLVDSVRQQRQTKHFLQNKNEYSKERVLPQ